LGSLLLGISINLEGEIMKKLVAVAVVFVLVTGAAFAQLSGTIQTRFLIENPDLENADGSNIMMGGWIETASVTMTGTNEAGTVGGQIRIRAENITSFIKTSDDDDGDYGRFHKAYVWWRPIPQLRVFLGMDPDGLFENAVLTGWQFHQGGEEFMAFQNWDFWRTIFPGNWDTFGLSFTLYPVQGVQLNLVLPTGGPSVDKWPRHGYENVKRKLSLEEMFPWGLRFSGSVGIPDIGRVMFSYIGPANYDAQGGRAADDYDFYGDVGLSFLLTALEGFQIQVGFSTKLAKYDDIEFPFYVGAAAFYTGADFGVKFRVGAAIGCAGSDNKGVTYNGGDMNVIHGSIMPYFSLGGGRLNVDVGVTVNAKEDVDPYIGFWINPYFTFGPLVAGLQIYTVGAAPGWQATVAYPEDSAKVKLRIPIMLTFSM
jgi:hypothetical protein